MKTASEAVSFPQRGSWDADLRGSSHQLGVFQHKVTVTPPTPLLSWEGLEAWGQERGSTEAPSLPCPSQCHARPLAGGPASPCPSPVSSHVRSHFGICCSEAEPTAALPPSPRPDTASGEDQKPHPGVNAVDWLRRHSSKDAPTQTCRSEEWAMGGRGDQKKCAGLQAQTPCLGDGGGQQRHAWR
uniref:Uncharacterized protein n=1 Tax=Rousettus aegyptiacus TaxID=9407 RepID=A0A7J8KAF4_ROUAE|nr:hypothetical protein HJG63_007714 [Rousettus aegyptiacus]